MLDSEIAKTSAGRWTAQLTEACRSALDASGTAEAVMDEKTTQISLWPGVRFTEEERRSILAQLDRMANPDAARRARWNRISDAREAFMATLEPQRTTNG